MDFLTLFHTLLALNEKFPGMLWEVEENDNEGSNIRIVLPISRSNAELLNDGKEMFS